MQMLSTPNWMHGGQQSGDTELLNGCIKSHQGAERATLRRVDRKR
jgi:hypothetical protein